MIRKLARIGAICLAMLVPVASLAGGSLKGQEAPAFVQALDRWLSGDEARALPEFAALAKDGNSAAQVMLGLIDTTPALQGLWLAERSRDERLSLLRDSGGLSGVNWMRRAADTEHLAQLWLRLWSGAAEPAIIVEFAGLKEPRAAHLAAKVLALREVSGFLVLADHPDLPEFAKVLALREAWHRSGDGPLQPLLGDALAQGHPGRKLLGLPEPAADVLDRYVAADPTIATLQPILARICPIAETRLEDQQALIGALGGWWGLAELGSPLASAIADDVWAQSQMGLMAVARSLPSVDPSRGLTTGSTCVDAFAMTYQAALRAAGSRRSKAGEELKKGP